MDEPTRKAINNMGAKVEKDVKNTANFLGVAMKRMLKVGNAINMVFSDDEEEEKKPVAKAPPPRVVVVPQLPQNAGQKR